MELNYLTFLSDNRGDLAHVSVPTVVIGATQDAIAPQSVGDFVRDHIAAFARTS